MSRTLPKPYVLLFFCGALLLALQPVSWLVRSWFESFYDSIGLWVMLLIVGLLLWSLASPRSEVPRYGRRFGSSRQLALLLLAATAVIRLLGQTLGVNVIGALALVVDVYALGLLLGLEQRRRALAPGWLALLFAFCLPLERIIQRTSGYLLQQISADGACGLLQSTGAAVECAGLRMLWHGHDVLVDLPCSGAAGLTLLLALFATLATLCRPRLGAAIVGVVVVLAAAFVANVLRIVLLAVGLVFTESLGGLDVMAAPWHEAIGLLALAVGAAPVFIWARGAGQSAPANHARPDSVSTDLLSPPSGAAPGNPHPALAPAFLLATAVIVSLPAQPIDVAREMEPISLPASIAEFRGTPAALTEQEQLYFTRYGGAAARATYGPFGLLTVSTSAPLRHLHAPDECLTGRGHEVRYLGQRRGRIPTALYRSIDPQGHAWRIAVTFVSDRGEYATSVTEAVWHWFHNPGATWTMVQRIGPWELPVSQLVAWDDAVVRALDLPITKLPLSANDSAEEFI